MKTLFVSDLDGTLLNDNQQVSEFSAEIINELVGKGMYFTYATARSYSTAHKVTSRLTAAHPAIVYNGCAIVESTTGKVINKVWFSTNERDYVMLKLLKYNIFPLVYSYINGVEKVSFDRENVNSGMKLYLDSRKGDSRLNPTSKDKIYEGDVFYFTIIGRKEELLPLWSEISGDERFNSTFQLDRDFKCYWLEIMPKDATKARAIDKLKKILGCEKVVCFGDAVNDIPMFLFSDERYAVENSVEKLKVMSTEVIGNNNEDSVAKKMQELFYKELNRD